MITSQSWQYSWVFCSLQKGYTSITPSPNGSFLGCCWKDSLQIRHFFCSSEGKRLINGGFLLSPKKNRHYELVVNPPGSPWRSLPFRMSRSRGSGKCSNLSHPKSGYLDQDCHFAGDMLKVKKHGKLSKSFVCRLWLGKCIVILYCVVEYLMFSNF